MGGRGASSGISKHKAQQRYGTQFKTILQQGKYKFVKSIGNESLMETMAKGRVYIQVGGKELLRIIFFDESNKRNKTIEKDKRTGEWHTHYGYEHAEYSEIKHQPLTEADKKTLEKVNHIWSNRNRA